MIKFFSFLIQMSPVELGGATVFTELGVRVPPTYVSYSVDMAKSLPAV